MVFTGREGHCGVTGCGPCPYKETVGKRWESEVMAVGLCLWRTKGASGHRGHQEEALKGALAGEMRRGWDICTEA